MTMKYSTLSLLSLALSLTSLISFPLLSEAKATNAKNNKGRAESWSKGGQNSPDLLKAKSLVASNPKDPIALNDLGFALRQNEKLNEAEKYLKQALELKPDLAEAHANLSVVYYDQKKYDKALDEAQKAVKLNTDQAIFRVVLGNALSKSGNLKGAIQEFKVALQLQPRYENAYYNLGRTLSEDGQINDAKYALAKALELDEKDDRVISLLDKLDRLGKDEKASESLKKNEVIK